MLNNVVTIIENPQNPMGIKKTIDSYAESNGTWVKVDEFIQDMRESLGDAKVFVQQEPLGPNEINPF